MLKGIPPILSPDLLKILTEMGHGDEIVLADGNFPAASHAQRLIRADGHSIPDLLKAILTLFPLDSYVEQPITLMAVEPGDGGEPVIWQQYQQIANEKEGKPISIDMIDRFSFYERAKETYAIVATGERALYANVILKKGVIG
ncbi:MULTISPECIES: L-fucose mutarotase [Metabacillus]|uniref:Fucose isomerase n=2 Tax=Metabacillus TaxID=2675233 RepID=A0A179T5S6_9BACI|nr:MULTISPECIES: L-fucose mutarotase [Metabacillus]OAS89365.1 fucose isomerase [Metabacillus litoralis]QNF28880.1 L-fucose mutarotase [Metabacillus sp. KUDC1714]